MPDRILSPRPGDGELGPGTVVGGRFRVIRFLASGGMGEVYEAEDMQLDERIALKVLRGELARDPRARTRFEREVKLARKVTHPNVCRLFDVGVDGEGGRRILFLTMELLAGETLAARIERDGPLAPTEGLAIGRQIAAGLDAAHAAGVVHRDLKTGNVILVASDSGGPPRAVVTDFGIARAMSAEGELTASGAFVGTPAFASPEQAEGRDATPASDLYSFGLVLYQMMTGTLPFEADSIMASALARLTRDPEPPRARRPDLSESWNSTILRCLDRDPARRFASAGRAVAALAGDGSDGALDATVEARVPGEPAPSARRPGRRIVLGVAAAAALAAAATAWLAGRGEDTAQPAPGEVARSGRRALAILGFRNLSGRQDADWLSSALTEMFSAELAAGAEVRMIGDQPIQRVRRSLGFEPGQTLSREQLASLRERLGADVVLSGSYVLIGDPARLRIDVRVDDTGRGETIASVSDTGPAGDLFELVARTGSRLRQGLGLRDLAIAERGRVRETLPRDPAAERLYAEARARMRRIDFAGAVDPLERAAAIDPSHPLIQAALAEAYLAVGETAKAQAAARRAVAQDSVLSDGERAAVEARLREASGDWQRAIDLWTRMFRDHPDDLETGVHLVYAQLSAGRAADALATLRQLRRLPPPDRNDLRLDVLEAWVAWRQRDTARADAASTRAVAGARAAGENALLAEALRVRSAVLELAGRSVDARATADEARQLFTAIGNRSAALEMHAGGPAPASAAEADAQELASGLGGNRIAIMWSIRKGMLDAQRGQLTAGRAALDAALTAARASHDREVEALALGISGYAHAQSGDLRTAHERLESCLGLLRDLSHDEWTANALTFFAEIELHQGALEAARAKLDEADRLWDHLGLPEHRGATYFVRGMLGGATGDRRGARAALGLAAAVPATGENAIWRANALALRARLAPDAAAARPDIEKGRAVGDLGFESQVRLELAEAAHDSRPARGAARAADQARRCEGHGFIALSLEARLVAADLERAAGLATAARSRRRLAEDARARGFAAIAAAAGR